MLLGYVYGTSRVLVRFIQSIFKVPQGAPRVAPGRFWENIAVLVKFCPGDLDGFLGGENA